MVYIEEIIIIDTLIHIFFLNITGYISYLKLKKLNIVFSIILNILSIIIYVYLIKNIYINLMFFLLISLVSFYRKKKKNYIKEVLIYLTLNLIFGGINQIFYINILYNRYLTLILLFGFIFFTIFFITKGKFSFNKDNLVYDFIIIYNNKKLDLKLYLDTGNFLQSEDYLPIIILNKKYQIGSFYKKENCYTITGSKEIELYKVDEIYLSLGKLKKVEAYITFASMEYDGMCGLKIIEG